MLTAIRINEEVDDYRSRVKSLFQKLRNWITERRPNAAFSEIEVEISEELTGIYKLNSLEVSLPNSPPVRFVPRGIFMVGAHGRVDVRSRLGQEILVWLEAGGPNLHLKDSLEQEPEMMIGRPLFDNVEEGWNWLDYKNKRTVSLGLVILWDEILTPLTE